MKSTIFEGIAERLAEIQRDEGKSIPLPKTSRRIIEGPANPPIVDPVGFCSVYGHDIGLTGICVNCGLHP